MSESPALIAELRALVATGTSTQGDDRPPDAWLTQGLQRGQLHELYAAEPADGTATAGFAVALALAAETMPLLWIRTEDAEKRCGRLYATGLVELGLNPDQLLLAVVPDEAAQLRAAADAARCSGLGAVLLEVWGPARGVDLTATRKLMLAAETSGVTVLMLRADGQPAPSAAATRWQVGTLLSTAMAADAPGQPAFEIELLRRRGGPAGARWRVEWDRDAQQFRDAPLPGAGVSVVADRAAALDPSAPVRRAG